MDKEQKNLFVFGYGLAAILAFFAFRQWRHHGESLTFWVLTFLVLILAIQTAVRWKSLRGLYRNWMRVAHFIGIIITGVILTVFFFVVFGIAGIILRILKKDLLDRTIDLNRDSYWIEKEQKPFDKDQYTRQF